MLALEKGGVAQPNSKQASINTKHCAGGTGARPPGESTHTGPGQCPNWGHVIPRKRVWRWLGLSVKTWAIINNNNPFQCLKNTQMCMSHNQLLMGGIPRAAPRRRRSAHGLQCVNRPRATGSGALYWVRLLMREKNGSSSPFKLTWHRLRKAP
ncbi:hypothetical protein NDU88_010804 [Pleurodeles waltl]|uniref:Uncharacterized protein n=1 Tax=Pleurodeles waltl TaxID=8319 RepID=A0AAV7QZ32_PLEWA|nr:hypothetical protein NDU88_010804 [Pleurodeles waltl]